MLEKVPDIEDIRKMKPKELQRLSGDIREFLVDKVSQKGGHLASNLGTVELTVALYSVLNLPEDKLIWDVGHQSYTHKILSGRMEEFDTLRDFGGLSGFPKRHESSYDPFDTGHSSTSISAGLGLCCARDLAGEKFHVVSVIGDGSLTGGMAFEALNNASQLRSNFIIILNDNEMSIQRNVGGLSRYLNGIRSGPGYNKLKKKVKETLTGIPNIGEGLVNKIANTKDSIKEIMVPGGMLFENMGISYFGPVDGHNIAGMKKILKRAMNLNRCVIIHVVTKKGKGYLPAERRPGYFHGTGPFDKETGEALIPKTKPDWTDVFAHFMGQEGPKNPQLAGITAAMTNNVGLQVFRKKCPERFFDVGIAEQHAVTFAAGLAAGGMHPVAAVFSSFLQRGYDQIVHDVCLQDLPVTFAVDRAGIVGRDGETHQGAFDIAFMMPIPNMVLMAPKNADEMLEMLKFSVSLNHPSAVRYPRGSACTGFTEYRAPLEYGKAEVMLRGKDIAILALGNMVSEGMKAAEILSGKGYSPTLVNMRFAKPWDRELLDTLTEDHRLFAILEDGVVNGGLGEAVSSYLSEQGKNVSTLLVGIPDTFVQQGSPEELFRFLGMDGESIAEKIVDRLS